MKANVHRLVQSFVILKLFSEWVLFAPEIVKIKLQNFKHIGGKQVIFISNNSDTAEFADISSFLGGHISQTSHPYYD